LSNRNDVTQIYTMPVDGGEASEVTAAQSGVSSYRWSPDGTRIAFLAKEPKSDAEEKKAREHDDVRVADQASDRERLWIVDVPSKKSRQVTSGSWQISEFSWLNDDQIATIATDHPEVEGWTDAIYSVAAADGHFAPLARPHHPFEGLTISPGGTQLAFVATRNDGPISHDLFVQRTDGRSPRNVTAAIDRRVIETKWQDDSTAIVRVIDGFYYRLDRVASDGTFTPINLPYTVRAYDVSGAGTIAFVGVTFNRMPELYVRDPDGTTRQITHLHDDWSDVFLADAELFHIKSFDGRSIEAALMKPRTLPTGGKVGLILLAHGGPASSFTSDYFWFNAWAQLLATHGYQVLMVNPRGSAGYGEEFLKANRADWGGGDFKDLMAALDTVIARGEVDPQRIGMAGWSYGGEMTAWATTQTNRFKAAVVGGVVFDQTAEFEMEDSPSGDEWYFGTPWEHPDVFARNSPSTFIRNARTPTLILHGANDPANPVGQAMALYRALKHFKVEAQLVTYPREGHLPREEMHQVDMLRRMLAWFDAHLAAAKTVR
jgi:dipeptidyl aminopeptidase/acylaminoacyl peptidase